MALTSDVIDILRVTPGKRAGLAKRETNWRDGLEYENLLGKKSKQRAERLLEASREELAVEQELLWANDSRSLLVVFQAMDAAGKDGTIKHVMSGVNPQGCEVYSFKQPSPEELDHDFLWRTNKALPERGRIGIFNRSHYEEVLVVRVHPELLAHQKLPTKPTKRFWAQRYESINDMERHLDRNGTTVVKFFLHVSKDEQRKRLLGRLEEPGKEWKFSAADVAERAHWDGYMKAYEEVLTATSTPWAPWYVIPADRKYLMRVLVAGVLVDIVQRFKLAYPTVTPEDHVRNLEAKEKLLGRGCPMTSAQDAAAHAAGAGQGGNARGRRPSHRGRRPRSAQHRRAAGDRCGRNHRRIAARRGDRPRAAARGANRRSPDMTNAYRRCRSTSTTTQQSRLGSRVAASSTWRCSRSTGSPRCCGRRLSEASRWRWPRPSAGKRAACTGPGKRPRAVSATRRSTSWPPPPRGSCWGSRGTTCAPSTQAHNSSSSRRGSRSPTSSSSARRASARRSSGSSNCWAGRRWWSTGGDDALAAVGRLGPADLLVVIDHDHDVGTPALEAALRGNVGYVGGLGSRHTQAERISRLRADRRGRGRPRSLPRPGRAGPRRTDHGGDRGVDRGRDDRRALGADGRATAGQRGTHRRLSDRAPIAAVPVSDFRLWSGNA